MTTRPIILCAMSRCAKSLRATSLRAMSLRTLIPHGPPRPRGPGAASGGRAVPTA